MRHRILRAIIVAWLVGTLVNAVRASGGQAPSAPDRTKAGVSRQSPERTADGKPDLQGIWNFSTATPLERPPQFATKEFLTDQEVAMVERVAADRRRADASAGTLSNTPPWWVDSGTRVVGTRRSSLIVDPPDGRLPPMTPAGARRQADLLTARAALDGPESLTSWERCVSRGLPAVMLPGLQNNNLQLFQTPGYVAIVTEMVHETRIVPLDGRPMPPESIRGWMGYSRGRWEGDTLVIVTTHFSDNADFLLTGSPVRFLAAGSRLRLVERFTRIDHDAIDYQFTVEDPTTWTKTWTAAVPLVKVQGPLYEYACHEGNYSLGHTLAAARAADAADSQPKQ